MPYEALILDIRDHIATLTLNHPEAYNAVNAQMAGECLDAITQVDEDPTLRCVVITGTGKRSCAIPASTQPLKPKWKRRHMTSPPAAKRRTSAKASRRSCRKAHRPLRGGDLPGLSLCLPPSCLLPHKGAFWGRFLRDRVGAASLVSLAPAGGEGLGEGEGAPTACTLTPPLSLAGRGRSACTAAREKPTLVSSPRGLG
jgi:Enoyl-CoA hydratase/isomerase